MRERDSDHNGRSDHADRPGEDRPGGTAGPEPGAGAGEPDPRGAAGTAESDTGTEGAGEPAGPGAGGSPAGERDWLAGRFEEHRPYLRSVAHRMLGSFAEADDAVQETWLRLARSDAASIDNLRGWLTTVVGRVCLNALRSRAARREEPAGDRLPDPVVTAPDGAPGPEQEAVLADAVGLALLVVLDTLTPPERLAFVLHDLFGVAF